ncbi:hypothetical protein VDG1235_1077 [Verrucomicrobiia bacterium DG1235]|nr:hypothetical protein VDG1235_1077 [Verrucomicrobiae bacterium DG1235]
MKEKSIRACPAVLSATTSREVSRQIDKEMAVVSIDVVQCLSEKDVLRALSRERNLVLAVVDLDLPLLEAWHILEILQTEHPQMPSIAVGHHLEHLLVADAFGASAWLFKPLDSSDLKSCFLNALVQDPRERSLRAAGLGELLVVNREAWALQEESSKAVGSNELGTVARCRGFKELLLRRVM